MKKTIVTKIGSLSLAAVAVFCFTNGTAAKACNVPFPGSSALIVPDLAAIVTAEAANNRTSDSAAVATSVQEPAESVIRQDDGAAQGTIVGLWQITFLSGNQIVDVGFDAWHSDGTEMLNDTPPPATGNVCLGVWTETSHLKYKLKHPSWTFDNNGNLTGTAVIRESITLNNSRNTFNGTYTIDFYDNSGHSLGQYAGQVQATRITPN